MRTRKPPRTDWPPECSATVDALRAAGATVATEWDTDHCRADDRSDGHHRMLWLTVGEPVLAMAHWSTHTSERGELVFVDCAFYEYSHRWRAITLVELVELVARHSRRGS